MKNKNTGNFYGTELKDIYRLLNTNEKGLNEKEVVARLAEHGFNKLTEKKTESIFKIFLRQFKSPLIFVLLFSAFAVFLIGEMADSFVIITVLLFNSFIGTFQEGRAQNIFAALKNLIKTDVSVIRNGEEFIVSDEEIVPGDIVILREGGKVPADARLIRSESLRIDEATLTGESKPKHKLSDVIISKEAPISQQDNMVFKGTNVVSGNGIAVVVLTGENTVIGDIAKKITQIDEELPLKKDIRHLSNLIMVAVFVIGLFLLGSGILFGHSLKEIISTIIAVSVSVIPEGLPIVVTLVLATGVWRMGKKNVLVKRLQAVEALGQTDVIAVDKTGTVTKNELVVKEIYVNKKTFLVKGVGYDPMGEIELNGETIEALNHEELLLAGKIGALCSGAHLVYDEKKSIWKINGDPTEGATLVMSEKIGFRKSDLEKELKKIEERPFDYKLKYHSVLYKEKKGNLLMAIGAPEEILNISEKEWSTEDTKPLSAERKRELRNILTSMAKKGLRVVAFGVKKVGNEKKIPEKFILDFVGFLGIEDSPRIEVCGAVEKVRSAEIDLVMITGDHKVTARAIAKNIGVFKKGDLILEGKDVEKMTEKELAKKLKGVSIFSRVTPQHKLKIINAYKLAGKTVAMTGDGVNDALSLTSADVGVSMGKIGTEVAREASDIILLDDNFGSIVSGVEEGRNIYKTIKRVILYLFSTSIGEVMIIIAAILLGFPLPILASQILWLNLVTDGFLDMALAMETNADDSMGRKNKKGSSGLVDKLMIIRIFTMAVPMMIGTLVLFSFNYEENIQKAWTVSLTTMAAFQWFNAWNCRSHIRSVFSSNLFSNKFLIAATMIVVVLQLLAVYSPFFQKVLRTVPLQIGDWVVIIFVASSIVFIEEIRKFIYRKRRGSN